MSSPPRANLARLRVQNRHGQWEPMQFDRITQRLEGLMDGLDENFVDPALVTQNIAKDVKNNMTTKEIDALAAETCAALTFHHSDYAILGGRVLASSLQKET